MQTEILIKNSTLKPEAVYIKINGLSYHFTHQAATLLIYWTTHNYPRLIEFIENIRPAQQKKIQNKQQNK